VLHLSSEILIELFMASGVTNMVQHILSGHLRIPVPQIQFVPIGGGSINDTYKITINSSKSFFCKINSAKKIPALFVKEKNGLELLAKQHIIKTPSVIACEEQEGYQILILEWIEQGLKPKKFWEIFGVQLATLHQVTNNFFGLDEDNYMGACHQSNFPSNSWVDFFIHLRLGPQIKLAVENNLLEHKHVQQFQNLYKSLPEIFPREKPSLLHGDLWSGNFICDQSSNPVLIDPAVYFGNRHIDLAMTTLFGGFDREFYLAYHHHFPLPENHRQIWDICNLYPLLIHLNLFGRGYLSEILQTIKHY
jgi:protein-ribulosamine 3-kinase